MKPQFGKPPKWSQAQDLVRMILSKYKIARDDDWLLVFKVWEAQGVKLSQELKQRLSRCIHPKTIMRARRDLQKRHDWLRGKTYRQKQLAGENWRKFFGGNR